MTVKITKIIRMKVPKIITDTKRRGIRYIMFRKKTEMLEGAPFDFNKENPPYLSTTQANAIVKFYESVDGFEGWDTFNDSWDIGIDDQYTMMSRPNKFFLFGIKKTRVVDLKDKPKLLNIPNGDMSESGRLAFTLEKIGLAVYKGIRNKENRIFHEKILEDIEDRQTWNRSGLLLESEATEIEREKSRTESIVNQITEELDISEEEVKKILTPIKKPKKKRKKEKED